MSEKFNLQLFASEQTEASEASDTDKTAFDGGKYGNPVEAVKTATAGKNIIISIWNSSGAKLLAIKGQKSLKLNRKADSIDITTKDDDDWKAKMAGMKEWSLDTDGIYVMNDESHRELSKAFEESLPVLMKITDKKAQADMFGGLASITDYSVEAPYDDAMTYSISLEGMGKLVNLTEKNNAQEGANA